MGRSNLEIVQAAIDALNRGDRDAMLAHMSPAFEFDFSRAVGPDRGVFGIDETLSLADRLREAWESTSVEPHELLEHGNDVVVPWTYRVQGRDGIVVEARTTWVWTIRDGAITRVCMYQSTQDALDALGVGE